jgi:Protein of unknown function (DUF1566)/Secretion system C-terminal sorting domain
MQKIITTLCLSAMMTAAAFAQSTKTMLRLPDTGQNMGYTTTFGEDNDYSINPPHFYNNLNGTLSDTVTGLMWQRIDGGEMTVENAAIYADTLTLSGFTDWRLPTAREAFSILNLQNNNPALNTTYFSNTNAEYWWTSERQANDATKVWCTNSGGGVGNHPKAETISAGGVKKFHARAVRTAHTATVLAARFTDNTNGTITDNMTDLVWLKTPNTAVLTWEEALAYAENLTFAAASDWRLPNIKELQSLTDATLLNPCISTTAFPNIGIKKYWSSTSLPNQTTRAWYLSTALGITTYDLKTVANNAICVKNKTQTVATNFMKTSAVPNFRVFPNPTNGSIKIYFDTENTKFANSKISITNVLGQLMIRDCVATALYEITLPNGIYYVSVSDSESIKTVKVVVTE